jgi:hypothetical protein
MTEIITKVRNLIDDGLKIDGRDVYNYETSSSSKIFTLTESNISSSTIIVYKNGVVWAASNYSYSSTTGKLTITGTLVVGDILEVIYSYYAKYSDTELQGFIRGAISYLSADHYKCFIVKPPALIFPTPTESEENLIAIIATIIIKGDVVSYRTPELTILFERGDSKEKKIKKFIRQFKKTFGVLDYIDLTKVVVYDVDEEEEEEEDE